MNKANNMKRITLTALAIITLLGACNTSKITSSWNAQNVPVRPYSKILVLGLIREADRSIRERMEEHFAGDLTDLGYTAISALKEYGPKAFDKMDEAAALEKLKNSGVEAVITIVLLDKQKERKYMPAQNYSPRDFWGYYGYRNNRIYEPGYYVTNTKYFWESNFYDLKKQTLLYSVQTRSFEPANTEAMGHEYGRMIVRDMVKKQILKNKTETASE
jgi:hypothetical protein